jgi:hypothetical protein
LIVRRPNKYEKQRAYPRKLLVFVPDRGVVPKDGEDSTIEALSMEIRGAREWSLRPPGKLTED